MVVTPHHTPVAIHGSIHRTYRLGVGIAESHTALADYLLPGVAGGRCHRTATLAHRQVVELCAGLHLIYYRAGTGVALRHVPLAYHPDATCRDQRSGE